MYPLPRGSDAGCARGGRPGATRAIPQDLVRPFLRGGLRAEIRGGGESSDSVQALAAIFAAQLAGVLAKSVLFICNDSAPMHIAAAVKTPTVAIFGPSKSRETGPYGGTQHRVVEKEFPCRFTCDENTCKHKVHNACMHAIMPEDVLREVRNAFRNVMPQKV